MNKQELLEKLTSLQKYGDPEGAHIEADRSLLMYIDDAEIAEAFGDIDKWYA